MSGRNGGAGLARLLADAAAAYHCGNFAEAERLLAAALAHAPGAAELWCNRGSVLAMMKRRDEALAAFERAIALDPDGLIARANRANLLFETRRFAEASAEFDRVLAVQPDRPYAAGNRLLCRLNSCDWCDFEAERERLLAGLHARKPAVPPALAATVLTDPADQLRVAEILARDTVPVHPPLWHGEAYAHGRIRLAYVSADFRAHATATLTAGLFEAHDRDRFETFAISYGPDDGSAMRARLMGAFDHFVDVSPRSDADVAATLREREIDIAIDLKGYTAEARPGILARRPAPVQASYLGYPATMGAAFVDYIIADDVLIPKTSGQFYSERIVRLPHCYQPNDSRRPLPERAPGRKAVGLPAEGFVFCCFNAPFKILPPMFGVWMRLLAAVPGSVLWLLSDRVDTTVHLRREAAARGIVPERLIFAPRVAIEDHLARHACADLFLDSFPYNAHTTASDALWAGLPLVTRMGETLASRVAASTLRAVGLPELVTHSFDEYEALALRLARDAHALKSLKARLVAGRASSPLFDTARTARALERAYAEMEARVRRGEPPSDLTVPDAIAAPAPG
jgi:protein O-GlcNAc transferase